MLRRRRELVVLSADVQRAIAVRRLDRIGASPVRLALAFAAGAARVMAVRRLALAVFALAGRLLGRRREPAKS